VGKAVLYCKSGSPRAAEELSVTENKVLYYPFIFIYSTALLAQVNGIPTYLLGYWFIKWLNERLHQLLKAFPYPDRERISDSKKYKRLDAYFKC